MWNLKGIEINNLYKVDHFIEKTDFCEIYTGTNITSSKIINLSVSFTQKSSRFGGPLF